MRLFHVGDRVHLIDHKNRQYGLTLTSGAVYQFSGETLPHDEILGKPDGSIVKFSRGKTMLAVVPTLGEYTLKMPRGAQVLYPKDLAIIPMWADVYPGARVFEAGVGSGALTMALLRAVGDRGEVVSYEVREDFAALAKKNIERYLGHVPNLTLHMRDVYAGIVAADDDPALLFDRVILDVPEPWRVVDHAAAALRLGGIYLSFVPTIPQVMQTVEAIQHSGRFGESETFETLYRSWNIKGRSVRPDHRMVAHSGFITVARKLEQGVLVDRTFLPSHPPSPDSPDFQA